MRLLAVVALWASFIFCFSDAEAAPVSEKQAAGVVSHWFYERTGTQPTAVRVVAKDEAGQLPDSFYAVNVVPSGYAIVAADDAAFPIIFYSKEGRWSSQSMPPQMVAMLEGAGEEIERAAKANMQGSTETRAAWNRLESPIDTRIPVQAPRAVTPLVKAEWDQGKYHNRACPSDSNGEDGHALVGCVAVAMGQILHYHKHPFQGTGSHSYTHPVYGTLSAPFDTIYDWKGMPDKLYQYDRDVEMALYHMGVSVNMNYGPDGSSASSSSVPYALRNYFQYSCDDYAYRANSTDAAWLAKLRSNLDANRPVYYRGSGSGGHAFVLDGYEGSDHFHVNWGWYGDYNGYFYLNDMTPVSSYNFNLGQAAVFGIQPNSVDDNYEPNDTRATAYDLSNYEQRWHTLLDGPAWQWDDDFYKITVTKDSVYVKCAFSHADGDINMQLQDANGNVVASSTSTTDDEKIIHNVGPQGHGTYYIRVYNSECGAEYGLWWANSIAIAAPTGLNAQTGPDTGKVNLSWNAVGDATSYTVYYDEDSGNPPFQPTDNGTPTSGSNVGNVTQVTISNLALSQRYYFAVTATNTAGQTSSYSSQVSAVASPDQTAPDLGVNSIVIDDDSDGGSSGNADGNVNPGEIIELIVNLKNSGAAEAHNVSATLSTTDGYVTSISDDVEDYGDIGAGNTVPCVYDYDFTVSPACPDGHQITFALAISSDEGTWQRSLTVDVSALPLPAPTGVNAQTGSGPGEISLSWNAVAGATGYKIYYDEDTSNPPYMPTDDGSPVSGSDVGNVTQTTIGGLAAGQTYYCAVIAYDATGSSTYSAESSAQASGFALTVDSVVVDDDTNEQSYGNGDGQVNSGETIELIVTLRNGGGTDVHNVSAQLGTGDSQVTSLTDGEEDYGDIVAGGTARCVYDYDFTVSPSCPDNHQLSFDLTITSDEGTCQQTITLNVTQPPLAAPTGVSAQGGSATGSIDLSWSAVPGATGYKIHYDEDSSNPPFTPTDDGSPASGSDAGNTTSATITGLAAGDTYYCAVTAYDGQGETGYSSQVTAVASNSAVAYGGFTVDDDASGGSSGNGDGDVNPGEVIELVVRLDNNGSTDAHNVTAHLSTSDGYVTSVYDADEDFGDIAAGSSAQCVYDFDFTVSSSCPNGHSIPFNLAISADEGSWQDNFTVQVVKRTLTVPTGLSAQTGSSSGRVNLSWNAVTGATGYKVYYDEDTSNPPFMPTDDGSPASGSNVGNVTSLTVSSLTPGKTYYFAVSAVDASGETNTCSQVSAVAKQVPPPPAPTNVRATDGTYSTQVRVTWSSSSGAASYAVYRANSSSFSAATRIGTASGTSYSDTSASPPVVLNEGCEQTVRYVYYYYWVKGINSSGAMGSVSSSDRGHRGTSSKSYEPVLPSKTIDNGIRAALPDSRLAVRLRASEPIAPDTVWGLVSWSNGASQNVHWVPASDGYTDGWVVFEPEQPWSIGEFITMETGALTVTGLEAGPRLYEFEVAAPPESFARGLGDWAQPLWQPAAGKFPGRGTPVAEVEAEAAAGWPGDSAGLPAPAGAIGPVYCIGPDTLFSAPQRVWLPVPEGVPVETVKLAYLKQDATGSKWYDAADMEGWLVRGGELTFKSEGVVYLGILVQHGGTVQMTRDQTLPDQELLSQSALGSGIQGAIIVAVLLGFATVSRKRSTRQREITLW